MQTSASRKCLVENMATCNICFTLLCTILLLPNAIVLGNLYDPHVYPANGPFFEGWYARLTDENGPRSLGILFGRVLPKDSDADSADPLAYVGILLNRGDDSVMEVYEAFPSVDSIRVTVKDGHAVTSNPDMSSPADFEWCAKGYGCFKTTANETQFDFTVDGVRFMAHAGAPLPWGPNGQGPEGWVDKLPFLPLHWFVYSLGSQVYKYQLHNKNTGEEISGDSGHLHQEKNWGDSFPQAWIWAEGVNENTGEQLALSLGILDIIHVDIPAHLVGFRAPGLKLNYLPLNSYTTTKIDACQGQVNLTVHSLLHRLEITLVTSPQSLKKCLYGPTVTGFSPVCVEGYNSSAYVKVYKNSLTGAELVYATKINNFALEFGGGYLCQSSNPCR